MPVMKVGIVRVRMRQRFVLVRVGVRLHAVPLRFVRVLVVRVMRMQVLMLQRLMRVRVLVTLADVQPYA